MNSASTAVHIQQSLSLHIQQELLPANHPSHGTPAPMHRRVIEFTVKGQVARFEQTDYGHPGRWNPPDPRGIAGPLAPKTEALRQVATAVAALLD